MKGCLEYRPNWLLIRTLSFLIFLSGLFSLHTKMLTNQRKNLATEVGVTMWTFVSLPLFCTTTMPFCRTKKGNILVTHYVLWRNCCMCPPKIVLLFSSSLLFFSLPLIFTGWLLAYIIFSFSHHHYEISCFSSDEIHLLCFYHLHSHWLFLGYPCECRNKK